MRPALWLAAKPPKRAYHLELIANAGVAHTVTWEHINLTGDYV